MTKQLKTLKVDPITHQTVKIESAKLGKDLASTAAELISKSASPASVREAKKATKP